MRKVIGSIKKVFSIHFISSRLRSIQFVITASFMTITIFFIVFIGITLYNKFNATAEQNAATSTRQIIDQININLDYYLRSMMDISNALEDIIYSSEAIPDDSLITKMDVILNSRKDIVSLDVFSDKGELITGVPLRKVKAGANIKEQDWFKAPLRETANLFFSSPHVQNIFEGQHSWVVSLSREITFNMNGQKMQGVLLVDMNCSVIDQLCKGVGFGKKGYVYLIDSKGNIVYHPQQQLINIGLKSENTDAVQSHVFGSFFDKINGENRLIIVQTVNYCRWRIVGVAYTDEIVTAKKEISGFLLWILVFSILFVIFISSFISSKISDPIKKLEKSMKSVENGRFDVNVDIKGEDEVVKLSRTFNIMVSKIRDLMEQILLEQEEKRKSELNALQAQINPHFLYNTLDSIVWMAENGKSQDVIMMVTALAKLFRISISKGRNIITVQEELEHARNYLIIQKRRYKNKFKFEIEAEEEVLQNKTLKLILQPIIENAIYHGIEYMVDEGQIKITVSSADGKLLYRVMDNGVGMSPEVLEHLLEYESKSKGSSGVGVKNVHQRIQLYCGKEYGLTIESEQEVGTNVSIWLPLVCDEKREVIND